MNGLKGLPEALSKLLKLYIHWPPAWIGTGIAVAIYFSTSSGFDSPPLIFSVIFALIFAVVITCFLSLGYAVLLGLNKATDKESPTPKDPLRREVQDLQTSGSSSQAECLSVFLDLRDQILENAAASKLPDSASAGILELTHETCASAAKTLRRHAEDEVDPDDDPDIAAAYTALREGLLQLRDLEDACDASGPRSLSELTAALEKENDFSEALRNRVEG